MMSRLILDTHVFLWWVNDAPNLTGAARRAISNPDNECKGKRNYQNTATCNFVIPAKAGIHVLSWLPDKIVRA